MESISVKPVRIREKKVNLNPLRNPISSLHQWTALKAIDNDNGGGDIETGLYSYQVFPKDRNHGNPLLNPVADFHEWRALLAKDTKPLMIEQPRWLPQGRYHGNSLLNPVADFHQWTALLAKDTKPLTTEQPLPQPLPQALSLNSNPSCMVLDEEVAIDVSLSCWLSSDETAPTK